MAATPVIELFNDIVNNRMVIGTTDSTPVSIDSRKLFQNSKLSIRWYPIFPPPGIVSASNPYLLIPVAGLSLDVGIGPRAGSEAILARQNVWVDSGLGYLYAILNLNTSEMIAAIGTSDSLYSFFEIQMTESGNQRPVYQEAVNIISVVIGPASSASLPAAAANYYTTAQIDTLLKAFVKFLDNLPGSTITLASPTTGRQRILGVNEDGSALDALI